MDCEVSLRVSARGMLSTVDGMKPVHSQRSTVGQEPIHWSPAGTFSEQRMQTSQASTRHIELRAPLFPFKLQIGILVLVVACWNTDLLTASDTTCGQSELSQSEISVCLKSGVNCVAVGVLAKKVQVFEEVSESVYRFKHQEPNSVTDRFRSALKPSLIYFQVVKPMSIRFSGKGFRDRFLFEIGDRGVSTTYRCVGGSTKWLSPGRYVLQSFHDMDYLSERVAVLGSTIEPLDSAHTQDTSGILSSEPIGIPPERKQKRVQDPSKEISFWGRFGLVILGVLALVWHFDGS